MAHLGGFAVTVLPFENADYLDLSDYWEKPVMSASGPSEKRSLVAHLS